MIPRSGIDVRLDEPEELSGFPPAEEAESDYLDGNREYDCGLLEAAWTDADEALRIERSRLEAAARADSLRAFEDALEEDLEDWEVLGTYGLDIGIAAAVLALNAAGCVTSTSCRGHADRLGPDRDYPKIRFYADPSRGRMIRQAAKAASCGFGVDDEGIGMVWAPSLEEIVSFAEQILMRRMSFDALPPRSLS